MACEGYPTQADALRFKENADAETEFMESSNETFQTPEGQTKLTLDGAIGKFGWRNAGLFADGFTYESGRDYGVDSGGQKWVWNGAYPHVVVAGTVPAEPLYTEFTVNALQALSGLNEPSDLDNFYSRSYSDTVSLQSETDQNLEEMVGNFVATKSYHPSPAIIEYERGASEYTIKTIAQFVGIPDGKVNFYIGQSNSYIAELNHKGTISVFQAGAKADDSADFDPDACQAILDLGFQAHHEKATYRWNKSVDVYSGSTITGAGFKDLACRITVDSGIIAIGNANADVRPGFEELNNVKINGIAWSGAGAYVTRVLDSDPYYYVEWEISECWFSNAMEAGIQGILLTSIVRDNRFGQGESGQSANPNHRMLFIKGTKTPNFTETNATEIIRNRFRGCPPAGYALYMDYGFGAVIRSNIFQACDNYPIVIRGIYPCTIYNNYFEANTAPAYAYIATDTADSTRWCLVNWSNNLLKQTSGLDSVVETTDDGRVWIDFNGNAGDMRYLTRTPDGVGGWDYETKVRESSGNFAGAGYLGNKAFSFNKVNWSPTASTEEAKWENEINKPYRFNSGSIGVELGGVSNYEGLVGSHSLLAGIGINQNLTIGIKSNRTSENWTVKNWTGTEWGIDLIKIRADGFVSIQGVYDFTNAGAANVVVTADGFLRRSTSARKFKENERVSVLDTSKVYNLTPVLFDYKDRIASEIGDDGIARDIIVDEGDKDCTGYIADDSGDFASIDTNGEPEGINWNLITISLVEEIKKLKNEIDQLKSQ